VRTSRAAVVCLGFLLAGCASNPAVPRPSPGSAASRRAPAASLVRTALDLRGAPYRNGGVDPRGFDCSGFVYYVFQRSGYPVPRVVGDQYRTGHRVDRSRISPGDLVFFTTVSRGASHVGIALSRDEFVHAPSSRGVVRVERLSSTYWSRRFVGARRLVR
jgi:cell wall-associated NlpC family hydrolase